MSKAQWVSDFCGCCSYKDYDGNCIWCPYFLPMSLLGPCCVIGRVETILAGEKPGSCEMGSRGWCTCVVLGIAHLFSPFPVSPIINVWACCQRRRIVNRYNVESGCCDILKGCCFPCALFQHYAFLSEMQARGQANALGSTLLTADSNAGVVVAQPVSSKANESYASTTLMITLPDGVVAGQSIQVRKPDGGSVWITVPRGAKPGNKLEVRL